jgi:hypothetical protein
VSRKLVSLCLVGVLFSGPVLAQSDEALRYDRALAAGYKAQFLCSGLWNGGKTLADIEADELTGIYPRIADIVPTLAVEVDEAERQVSVQFAEDMPPRIAIWNRKSGCTAMPIAFDGTKWEIEMRFHKGQPGLHRLKILPGVHFNRKSMAGKPAAC